MKRNFILGLVFIGAFLLLSLLRGSSEILPSQKTIGGRYQIIINSNMRADTFLLDTDTGRIWQQTQFTDLVGTPTAWEYVPRIDSDADLKSFYSKRNLIPTQSQNPTQNSPLFNGILKDIPK